MLRRFDTWLGSKLFVPIIIRICQATGITQLRFFVLTWWVATLWQFYWLTHGFWGYVFVGVCLLTWTLAAGLNRSLGINDSRYWFRLLVIIGTVLDLAIQDKWQSLAFDVMILAAEYALTIKTIPPKQVKEKNTRRSVATAKAGG